MVEDTGFHDNPVDTVRPAVNWIAKIIGDAAFPWVAGIIIGFAAGVWLDWFLKKFSNIKEREIIELGKQAKSLGSKLETLHGNHRASPAEYSVMKYSAEVEVMESKLNKLGIKTIALEPFFKLHPENPFLYYLENTASLYYQTGEYLINNRIGMAKTNADRQVEIIQDVALNTAD